MIYLLIIWGDTWPEIEGPFDSVEDRDAYAGKYRSKEGDEHGLFRLCIDGIVPHIFPYSGGEMDALVEEYENES